jgi:hypothetical protein
MVVMRSVGNADGWGLATSALLDEAGHMPGKHINDSGGGDSSKVGVHFKIGRGEPLLRPSGWLAIPTKSFKDKQIL